MAIPVTTNNATLQGRDMYFATLSATSPIPRLQTLEEAGYPLGNYDPALPEELRGLFDGGFYYLFYKSPVQDGSGNVVGYKYRFNEDIYGAKIPVYLNYNTSEGDDGIKIVGSSIETAFGSILEDDGPKPDVYALYLSTIRLGGGNDYLQIVTSSFAIPYSYAQDISIETAQGFVMQSSVFAGDGDDFVSPLLPRESVFKGGANTDYSSTILSDDLTLEELSFGDTFELIGSRYDWDIEFKDGNGDGKVTVASILDESDYVATSNNNRIYGFERFKFGDYHFDLTLYDQIDDDVVYGQPEYFFEGADEDGAPQLNSSIAQGSNLWAAFRFNRTVMEGISGTATVPVSVYTGNKADTPYLVGALKFASLNTEGGDDIAEIGSADQASFDLGDGSDSIVVKGLFSKATGFGAAGNDNISIGELANSRIDAGAGDDVVEIIAASFSSSFDGGDGLADRIVLPGLESAYGFKYSTDSVTGIVTLRDNSDNSYVGFESFTFKDKSYSLAGLLAAINANFVPAVDTPDTDTPTGGPSSLPLGQISSFIKADPGLTTPQVLQGTENADTIIGGLYVDILRGEKGIDLLTGGRSADIFELVYSDPLPDQILDFVPGEDKIKYVDVNPGSALGLFLKGGTVSKSVLKTVKKESAAARSSRFLVYNNRTGDLFFNSNLRSEGYGAEGGLIARLEPGLKLKSMDFLFDFADPVAG